MKDVMFYELKQPKDKFLKDVVLPTFTRYRECNFDKDRLFTSYGKRVEPSLCPIKYFYLDSCNLSDKKNFIEYYFNYIESLLNGNQEQIHEYCDSQRMRNIASCLEGLYPGVIGNGMAPGECTNLFFLHNDLAAGLDPDIMSKAYLDINESFKISKLAKLITHLKPVTLSSTGEVIIYGSSEKAWLDSSREILCRFLKNLNETHCDRIDHSARVRICGYKNNLIPEKLRYKDEIKNVIRDQLLISDKSDSALTQNLSTASLSDIVVIIKKIFYLLRDPNFIRMIYTEQQIN